MLSKVFRFSIFFIAIISISCGNRGNKPDNAIARVNDKYLTTEDLQEILYGNNKGDSIAIVKAYIDNWIREQLVISMAEQNLPSKKKDFKKQLEAYRNSLILYAYESELVKQKLDTNVNDQQIKDYYNQNPAEFVLKDNIVKVIFAKLPYNSPKISLFRNLIRSEKPQDKEKLEKLCKNYASNYFLDESVWLLFDDLVKEIPIKTYDQEAFLKNNRFIEIKDSTYFYLVDIKGFMIKESVSPLSFEKERVRNIIINKRKIELIKNMYDAAFKEAEENKDYEIFSSNK